MNRHVRSRPRGRLARPGPRAGRRPASPRVQTLESRVLLSGTDVQPLVDIGLTGDAVVVQPDGKIVVAGHLGGDTRTDPRTESTLKRYLPNGTLDTTFGTNGVVRVTNDPLSTKPVVPNFRELVLQADGKIVAVGDEWDGAFDGYNGQYVDIAMRFTSAGQVDTGYGSSGIAHAFPTYNNYMTYEPLTGAALQSDGGVVFMYHEFMVDRYKLTYIYNTSVGKFDSAGRFVRWSFYFEVEPSQLSVRADDQIDVVGSYWEPTASPFLNAHFDFYTERRAATGEALPNAKAQINFNPSNPQGKNSDDKAYASAAQPDVQGNPRLVLAGTSDGDFALARLNADFTLDSTFGGDGKVTLDLGGEEIIGDVLALDDGRLLVVGKSTANNVARSVAAVFAEDGALDTTFGVGGWIVYASTPAGPPPAPEGGPLPAPPAPGEWVRPRVPKRDTRKAVPILTEDDVFDANVGGTAPAAALTATPPAVTTPGGASYQVTVRYTDDTGIKRTTLGAGDLQLVTPSGARLDGARVTDVDTTGRDPKQLVLTYRFTPPGGTWDSADNGTYWIALGANQVADIRDQYAAGSAASPGLGQFTVNVPRDATPPTASIAGAVLPTVTTAGAAPGDFTVAYTDNVAVDVDSLGAGDVRVVRRLADGTVSAPVGTVRLVARAGSDGTPRTATYRLDKAFTAADNGTYVVQLVPAEVRDWIGNYAAGSRGARGLGQFAVDIPAGQIWGCVFHDADGDGAKARSERKGLRATLYLDLDGDGQYDPGAEPMTTSSPRSGNYAFLAVAPGTYALRQVAPTGYRQSMPRKYYKVTVADGDNDLNKPWYRFGDTTLPYLCGTVYADADGDGSKDAGEAVLAGRRLFADTDRDGVFDRRSEPWTLSQSDGTFALSTLPIGDVWLGVEPGRGYSTAAPAGGYRLSLGSGEVANGLDFGLR